MEEGEMTNEDELAIAHYMNWHYAEHEGIYYYDWDGGQVLTRSRRQRNLDLNDAGLVVQEMQKRGDWITFVSFVDDYHYNADIQVEFTAWLFNAENFFLAFCEWRRYDQKRT
jgi:hypothetical protein